MTRRTDSGLRNAISVIEKMLVTNPRSETVIKTCLDQLLLLINVQFGFSYQCSDAEKNNPIPWNFPNYSTLESGLITELPNFSTSGFIPKEIQGKLLAGRCLSSDKDGYSISMLLPHGHCKLSNYFCVPLVDARRIYAVMFLCNKSDGFASDLDVRIRPFMAAASCLMRTSFQKQLFQQKVNLVSPALDNQGLLSGVLDTMFNGVIIVDEADRITLCNNAAASILSLTQRDIIGKSLYDFFPKGAPQIESHLHKQGTSASMEEPSSTKTVWRGVPALNGGGEKMLVDLSAFEIPNEGRCLRGLVIDDISERLQSATDYHDTLQRFQVLTNLAPIGILQLDRNWECTYCNDTWCDYSQMSPEEVKGIGWLRSIHFQDADEILNELRTATELTGKYTGEFRLHSPLGRVIWVKASACSLYSESGEISGLIITFNDISEHLNNEQRLRDIAEKDQLTGLVNRTFFNDRVEVALSGIERYGSVALMFIDLDEFKHINDTLGHEAGDELLQGVADRLRETLRQVDTIARIGGDEFTVLLTNVQNTHAVTLIADKLIDALNDPFILAERPIYVTCSIGIAVAETQGATDTKQLLKQADVALYKAKDAGRNQYKFYTTELDKNANLHIHLRHSLKEVERGDFRVVYQPQVDATTGSIIGLEALSRWEHPAMEPVTPDIFIKMIEESGLITDFSNWLLENVFGTMSRWQKMAGSLEDLTVSINLSAKQFRDSDLAFYIHQRCRAHGLSPKNVVLEVTETALIDDPNIASATLHKLKKMGFGIALDDFGTGYSSLLYLRNMPLQTVKIDRSFIKDILHEEGNAKIVSAILSLAETLGLDVVAEGVDNTDVRDWLIANNCPIQQGFYFYKPIEVDEVEALMHFGVKSSSKIVSFDSRVG